MKNHFYIPSSQSQRDDLPLWDLESLDNESGKTPIPANIFPQVCYCRFFIVFNRDDVKPFWQKNPQMGLRTSLWFQHVDLLHADGGLGFQKEYDYIQAATSEKKGDHTYCCNNNHDDNVWELKASILLMSDDRRQVGRFKQLDLGGRIPEQERLCDDQYIQVSKKPPWPWISKYSIVPIQSQDFETFMWWKWQTFAVTATSISFGSLSWSSQYRLYWVWCWWWWWQRWNKREK